MIYKIRGGVALDAVLAKMSGMVCITGIKLPVWLQNWTADWPNRLGTPAHVSYLPEHHLNILEQAAFIDGMHTGRITKADMVITQSPFIISDFPKEHVLVFDGKSQMTNPDFQTFGASANKIMLCLLGQTNTIGNYAKRKFDEFRERLDTGDDPSKVMDEVGRTMGDSVEKTLFINMCIDKEEANAKHS